MLDELLVSGFVLCPGAVEEPALGRLLDACSPTANTEQSRHRSGVTYGIRGLLWSSPTLKSGLDESGVSALARAAIGPDAFPIDAIFFDKQVEANWSVPGHQDRLMPMESGSVAPKTVRNGVAYAEPPPQTLGALVALRVHFDAAGPDGGALEVIEGSHRLGILSAAAIEAIPLAQYRPCLAARGDILMLRPLVLHRSGRRVGAGQRRVLHVVYANEHPPGGQRWKGSAELGSPGF
jgi:hypothetical protein